MSSSNITSIYIPRMCVNTTEDEIIKLFYDRRIGFVKRVDFIPIDKKPGFRENLDNMVKACFIHLQSWVRLPTKILEKIENDEGYILYLNEKGDYWILLKATNPVQDTMMNNHQIVDNCRHLEKRIEEQANEIKELKESITNIKDCMYQFFGGLYCQRTQGHMINNHIAIIEGKHFDYNESNRNNPLTHKWGGWPTTRQGDSNEARIQKIEEKLNMAFIKEDDDEDIMTEDEHEILLKTPGSFNLTRLDSNM